MSRKSGIDAEFEEPLTNSWHVVYKYRIAFSVTTRLYVRTNNHIKIFMGV